jgi:hypothetical protein
LSGTGQTIPVAPYKYASLKLLAMHVNGNQTSGSADAITVTYVGGITQTFAQQYSNWSSPQNYPGESTAVTMAYRDLPGGTKGTGPYYIYGYAFALADWLPVQSISLPNDANFVIVAMDLTGMTLTTPAAANPSTVTGTTTSLSALATVPAGDASPLYTWAAVSTPAGAAAPTFSINGTTAAKNTTVTFYQVGSYTFRVEIEDPTSGLYLTSSVTVVVQPAPAAKAPVRTASPPVAGIAAVLEPATKKPRRHVGLIGTDLL